MPSYKYVNSFFLISRKLHVEAWVGLEHESAKVSDTKTPAPPLPVFHSLGHSLASSPFEEFVRNIIAITA